MLSPVTVIAWFVVVVAVATAPLPSFLFILGDDIGWGDFSYNNGTAFTPNIDAWAQASGSILMQDMHSGGTVCSPTRATVLTGRNHFRDCVDYVYDCSDMTECVPKFNFAPQQTFTVANAVHASNVGAQYASQFFGKWHLGSFYNDSAAFGGIYSSPFSHGFQHFNATVEVAPTATTNCQCRKDWDAQCNLGHYGVPTHCSGGANPGGPTLPNGCCFNYWWNNASAPHAVSNLSNPVGDDDSIYLADAFDHFVASRNGAPFLAQISFHNCHIPFIGTNASRAACAAGTTCRLPAVGAPSYTNEELDYYACISELDASVGRVLGTIKAYGYYENTMTWLATDNGPEVNCQPEGFCTGTATRPGNGGAGSAGILRGRKRDIYEGGHRVPGIISWPATIQGNRVSWDTVVTFDFMPTVMEILGVDRPPSQVNWAFDGVSVLPILLGGTFAAEREIGWIYNTPTLNAKFGWGGKWKFVQGSTSCSMADCRQPQLFDLSQDLGEKNNLAALYPAVLAAITANFTTWYTSVLHSIAYESQCSNGSSTTTPAPPVPGPPSSNCSWVSNTRVDNPDSQCAGTSKEVCCGLCWANKPCAAVVYEASSQLCHFHGHMSTRHSAGGYELCMPT